jgi:hypothetical protein
MAAATVLAAILALSCATTKESTGAASGDSAAKDRAIGLVQGQGVPSQTEAAAPAGAAPTQQQPEAVPSQNAGLSSSVGSAGAAGTGLSPDDQTFLQNYLSHLTYMVYYKEGADIDPIYARIAVGQADRYLIEKEGLSVIDFDQIESNKKDQQAAWQAETGGSVGIMQYLAQKLNADVYVEIDFSVSSETRDAKYYASASGTMKIFEASTAALLGSVVFDSQPAFSPSSMDAAVTNAVAASVWLAMPKMTAQAKALLQGAFQRGIRYELVIQKTPDAKALGLLRQALAKKLREVEQVSYSPGESKFYLYSFTGKDKIQDAIFDAALAAGFPDLYLVLMRGKSFTFNTGL